MPGMGNGERDNARQDAGLGVRKGDEVSLAELFGRRPEDYELGEPEYRKPQLGTTGPADIREEDECSRPLIDFQQRHPNSERFHELLRLAGELHDQKQRDYGKGDDPFANVRASTEWGIPGWVGSMVRLNDKVRRLQALIANGSLANESAIDSFMDIAVYALIARVLYEQDQT